MYRESLRTTKDTVKKQVLTPAGTRILFLPGIQTFRGSLDFWQHDLEEAFPEVEVTLMDEIFYYHYQHEKLDQILQQGKHVLADGKPTVILAHSFGGILGKTLASIADNADIRALITMATPFHLDYKSVQLAKQHLDTPKEVDVPLETWGGYLDPIVPAGASRMGNEPHHDLWCEHLAFLFHPPVRKQVISVSLKPIIRA